MIDGVASEPFSARGLPPLTEEEKTGNVEKIIKVSRERYAEKREVVEEKISRWHLNEDEDDVGQSNTNPQINKKNNKQKEVKKAKIINKTQTISTEKQVEGNNKKNKKKKVDAPANNSQNSEIYKYSASCNRCGKETKLSFQPDGLRPVYCKDCLSLIKQEKRKELEERKRKKQEELKKIKEEEISLKDVMKKTPVKFTAGKNSAPNSTSLSKKDREYDKEGDDDFETNFSPVFKKDSNVLEDGKPVKF